MNEKREPTKKGRALAFKEEQKLCVKRLKAMITVVELGDYYEMRDMYQLIGVCLEYLKANDPSRDK